MKNLIMVSLDSVRADVAYSGKLPTIEKLRSEGVSFLNCISSSPLTPTSHATVLTGLQPYNHGIRHLFLEKLKDNIVTLPQILKSKGYSTCAIVSCPGMNKWYGFNKGFDVYDDEIPRLPDGSDPLNTVDVKLRGSAKKRAELVTKRSLEWLKDKKEPFFIFLHFFDAHWPYEAPEKFAGNNIYEEAIAYSDHYLGEFLKKIESMEFLESSLVVCFSDHGEDLGGIYENDKGGENLSHPEEFGHGCLLYDQTQKTFLIFRGSFIPKNVNIEKQVRLVDVTPTILDILGIEDVQKRDGLSLLPLINGEDIPKLIAYSETFYPDEKKPRGIEPSKKSYRIENKYKIIVHVGKDKVEIYDLENDPNEMSDMLS